MQKIHIISNRLPYSLNFNKENKVILEPSSGGLATGLSSVYKDLGGKWIGWIGQPSDAITLEEKNKINQKFEEEECQPIYLTEEEVDLFYDDFSNRTIWPLFHYFTQYAKFNGNSWEAFKEINQKFADAALEVLEKGDKIWVHDYQLMLVPEMIKSKRPDVTIGYFLHIPFPSYEMFRMLPWRNEILQGILGADLIGFHIYDYQRHFLSCVRRLFGYDISFNCIHLDDRIVMVDVFPMGIDYKKFADTAKEIKALPKKNRSIFHKELNQYFSVSPDYKLILSIDRLDYTKGIPHRLRAFENFLANYPKYRGKITLIMLAVPSRDKVDHYQQLRKEVEELVGKINGKYATINYTPVRYFYRSLPFENLVELYSRCDVALITPVRDGMNLVAKEYVACRTDNTGVIVLSEMAGAAKEMGEALLINPTAKQSIADSLNQALSMPIKEQKERISALKERVKNFDVFQWVREFIRSMSKIERMQHNLLSKSVTPAVFNSIQEKYKESQKRIIFLDYDGTLASFRNNPQEASPDEELHQIIKQLTDAPHNRVVIISGRDKETLGKWFKKDQVHLICEHGIWLRRIGKEWKKIVNATNKWMPYVRPILERFVIRTPGSFIEKKNYSLVWHYRKAEVEQAELRAHELKDELGAYITNHSLEIMEGNKVIEVKNAGINKGAAANSLLRNKDYDFIMAIGDDWTDEYMFRELPNYAYTVKVGISNTYARFNVKSVSAVRQLLKQLPDTTL